MRRTGPGALLTACSLVVLLLLHACAAGQKANGTTASSAGAGGDGGDIGDGAAMPVLTSGSGGGTASSGEGGGVSGTATLEGTVVAPNGWLPVSGALIYLSATDPEPAPAGVYCDKCIELTNGEPYALSAADGSFSFKVPAGDWQIVVQKGGFRRVRALSLANGELMQLPQDVTTLPSAASVGDEIPRIAVVGDGYDLIENTLAKLGLGGVDSFGDLIEGSETFDLYNYWSNLGEGEALLLNDGLLSQYQIVFFPCEDWFEEYLAYPQVKTNLRNFVSAGGRLYVTDWAYEVLNQPFAAEQPISWKDDDGDLGSATQSEYDAPATVNDQELADWLAAQGTTAFDLIGNWTIINNVSDYQAPDEDQQVQTMSPTVWVSADVPGIGTRPATVSFQYGCGRALFSTYHTEGENGQGLMPQERALLYILLEVAVCVGDITPPD